MADDSETMLRVPSDEAMAVLGRVAKAVSQPDQLRRFVENPAATVEGYSQLPSDIRNALEGLSSSELALLGRMHQTFADNGFFARDRLGGTTGIF
jgi:hypothetical protein